MGAIKNLVTELEDYRNDSLDADTKAALSAYIELYAMLQEQRDIAAQYFTKCVGYDATHEDMKTAEREFHALASTLPVQSRYIRLSRKQLDRIYGEMLDRAF